VTDTHFGVPVTDPFRWMEDWKSAAAQEWLKAQAAYARRVLDALPARRGLLARIAELGDASPTLGNFQVAGGRVFSLRRDPGERTPKLVMRPEARAPERTLIDPNLENGPEHVSIDWFSAADDGRHVAYGISPGGSEDSVLHVVESDTGEALDVAITRTQWGGVSWLPDHRSFTYFRFPERPAGSPPTDKYLDGRTHLHRLGGDPEQDPVVFARGAHPGVEIARSDFPMLACSAISPWMLGLIVHGVQNELTVYAAPRESLAGAAERIPWRKIADVDDGVVGLALNGDTAFLQTHRGAPRYQVQAVRLDASGPGSPRVIVPPGERVIRAIRVAGSHLLIQDLEGGLGRLRRVELSGGQIKPVSLPFDGAILEWGGEEGAAETLFQLTSWTVSPRVFRYDADADALEDTGWRPPSPVEPRDVEAHEVRVRAADGAMIPLSIIHRTGLARDGSNPTLITGYGSYGISLDPAFSPAMLAWYERGGIYAVAHVRGGGEYGQEWHDAGRGPNKLRTVEDFLACAEHLIAKGYTRPGRLAASGTSAGGITAGGALVKRPELWGAVILRVADTNALRSELMESGPANIPEFGTVTTRDGFRTLRAIDAYDQVSNGAAYPAVLITTGVNDPRVAPWQGMKMAARLQRASRSGNPVLLRVEFSAGHGMGSTKLQRDEELADQMAFLFWQLTDRATRNA